MVVQELGWSPRVPSLWSAALTTESVATVPLALLGINIFIINRHLFRVDRIIIRPRRRVVRGHILQMPIRPTLIPVFLIFHPRPIDRVRSRQKLLRRLMVQPVGLLMPGYVFARLPSDVIAAVGSADVTELIMRHIELELVVDVLYCCFLLQVVELYSLLRRTFILVQLQHHVICHLVYLLKKILILIILLLFLSHHPSILYNISFLIQLTLLSLRISVKNWFRGARSSLFYFIILFYF